MKVVQINVTCDTGSTGKICSAISSLLDQNNVENYIFYSSGKTSNSHGRKTLSKWNVKMQALCSRVLGNYGFNTFFDTRKLLKEMDRISPEIVHLHNLHGHNVNLTLLFRYFKKHPEIKLFWTFHDCWAFTGYCTHFTLEKCDKWINGCHHCPQRTRYSWFFDFSSTLFDRKRKLFTGLNMTIITPSKWLEKLVKKSFLKDYPVKIINNGIDLNIFQPVKSNFREQYNIPSYKFIILGVAFDWGFRKGLDVFIDLANTLSEEFQIVLVGTNKNVDQELPHNVISIHRTQNQAQLAEIYSAANLFINPTREDNYPTVNMESIACGTPVITFRTGGSPEMLNESCGYVVECDDLDSLINCIIGIKNNNLFDEEKCLDHARTFDVNIKFSEYIELYNIRTEDKKC